MPYGSGQLVRMALVSAKPWQRYVICGAMIGGGALLVAIGHVAGALLAAAGVFLGWRMIRYRMGSRSVGRAIPDGRDGAVAPEASPDEPHEVSPEEREATGSS